MNESASNKSEMQYFLEYRKEWKPTKRPQYMSELTRKQTSLIFKARSRMLKIKGNYKNGHSDLTCRICKNDQETQTHILEECPGVHSNDTNKIPKHQLFTNDTGALKQIANKLEYIMAKVE